MKLNKETLKQIIKEELSKVLSENYDDMTDPRNWGAKVETMDLGDLKHVKDILTSKDALTPEDERQLAIVKQRIVEMSSYKDPMQTPGMDDMK